MSIAGAWLVHILTASGAALGLFSAIAAAAHAWQLAFTLLGIALVVDALDGPLARVLSVKHRLPFMDGALLDLVVDYGTYVLVPAMVLVEGGLLAAPLNAVAAGTVTITAALYFADTRMKTTDAAFSGFPAAWNAVVFILFAYRPPEAVTLAVIAVLAVLSFAPVEFIHPVRVKRWRALNGVMTVAWAVLAFVIVASDFQAPTAALVAFAIPTLYLAAVGALQQLLR